MRIGLATMLCLGFFAQSAFASCWMECIARNPFNGSCISKTKMCNIEDVSVSIESMGLDVGAAYGHLKDEWLNLYGRLPEQLQTVLDTYPLTFTAMILPGTREFTLVTMALEEYVLRAKNRSQVVAQVIGHAPEWKAKVLHDGEAAVLMYEGIEITNIDWKSAAAGPVPDKYGQAFGEFVACVENADSPAVASLCLGELKKQILLAN